MINQTQNSDLAEIAKFDAFAKSWWDPNGEMKPLHQLNPLRLQYIQNHTDLKNKKILDVGCGGGILTEALAKTGAYVTGIDLSSAVINVARQHSAQQNLNIDYQLIAIEEMVKSQEDKFDVITCMEMLEHVPEPQAIIQSCAQLLKPGGSVFFSTINRNLKSFLFAIIGAEYILNLLPKGTHHYAKFIRPSELTTWACQAQLELAHIQGMRYDVLSGQFSFCVDTNVNYLIHFKSEDFDAL